MGGWVEVRRGRRELERWMRPISSIYCYVLHEGCVCFQLFGPLLLSHALKWEVKCGSARSSLRLLAQGLVLNAETGKSGNLGTVAELREDEDEAYFSSYGHYGIHEEMLKVRGVHTHTHTHTHTDQACRSHYSLVSQPPRRSSLCRGKVGSSAYVLAERFRCSA